MPELEKVDRVGYCEISLSAELESVSYEEIFNRFLATGKVTENGRLLSDDSKYKKSEKT